MSEPSLAPELHKPRSPGTPIGKRILVMHRDPASRDQIQSLLAHAQSSVASTASVAEALRLLEWRPTHVLLDGAASASLRAADRVRDRLPGVRVALIGGRDMSDPVSQRRAVRHSTRLSNGPDFPSALKSWIDAPDPGT